MSDWKVTAPVFVSCPLYFPPVLAEEIRNLGFTVTGQTDNGVRLNASLSDCMKLNLWLRTAHHVYWSLGKSTIQDAEQLYRWAKEMPWELWISPNSSVTVVASVRNDTIRDNRFAGLKLKDAIVDRIRAKKGRRPDAGSEKVGVVIFLHWNGEDAEIFFDTSGDPLSKRGYRLNPGDAPMQETLCAAVLLLAGWNGQADFVNPMCGSGTLGIEAAMIAANRAPSILREHFSFMELEGFFRQDWGDLHMAALAGEKEPVARFYLSDIDLRMPRIARENAERAGVSQWCSFEQADFRKAKMPKDAAMIVLNPEYGKRLGEEDALVPVYKALGDWIKTLDASKTVFVFAAQSSLIKNIGLRPDAKVPFLNGPLDCRWLSFPVYKPGQAASTLFKTKYPELLPPDSAG